MPPSTTATTTSGRSGGHLPGPEQIDVRSGHGVGQGAVVVVVPLQGQSGIVERSGCRAGGRGSRRNGRAGETDRAGRIDRFHPFDARQLRKVAGRPCHRRHRVEPDIVPAVKPFAARALLEASRRREYALHASDAEAGGSPVEFRKSGADAAAGFGDGWGLLALPEFEAYAAAAYGGRFELRNGRLHAVGCLPEVLRGAGGKQRRRAESRF